jgi:alpha-glucosidase (family GH31 glycosyl hydrolase)
MISEPELLPGTPVGGFGFQSADSGRNVWTGGPNRGLPGPDNIDPPAASHWSHAISAIEGTMGPSSFTALLRTDDPIGGTLELEIGAGGEGVLEVRCAVTDRTEGVVAVGHSFVAVPGERFFGFGERSDTAGRSAGVVENYVGEGPWQEHEYPFLEGIVPPWGMRQRSDATYFPVPWILSSRGYGVLIDNDQVSYFRIRDDDREVWSFEVEARELRYRVFAGPAPLDALRRFTEATGRQPAPGARWWFGPWYQTGHANHVPLENEKRQLAVLREARAPVSAAETHCRFLPLGAHRGHEYDERERASWFHSEGLATLSYLNPMIGEEYAQVFGPAERARCLQVRSDGSTCIFDGYVGDKEPPVTRETHFDFSSEMGTASWAGVASQLVGCGHDGWMEDFGEYTPLDAIASSGGSGTAAHNRYPLDYHRAAHEVSAELERSSSRTLARFVRSGWTGAAPHVPIVWGGDPTCGWGFDGLSSAVTEGLSMGASGIAMWGSDTGGFVSSIDRLTPELLRRWIQFSSCCPVMRTKSSGIEQPPYRRPQIWDPDVVECWVRWAAWHTQLNDYLLAAHAEYRRAGAPIMKAMGLVWPEHPEALECEDQYLLGPDLLVAPVLQPAVTERAVWIPPGTWIELWSGSHYDPEARSLILTGDRDSAGSERGIHVGLCVRVVRAPDDEIPVLVRAGSVIALLPSDTDTLADYGPGAPTVVRASDRESERTLLAWPLGPSQFAIGEDQSGSCDATDNGWRLIIGDGETRRYTLFADLRVLVENKSLATVMIDGRDISRTGWSYDASTRVLKVEFESSGGVLEIVTNGVSK